MQIDKTGGDAFWGKVQRSGTGGSSAQAKRYFSAYIFPYFCWEILTICQGHLCFDGTGATDTWWQTSSAEVCISSLK